MRFVRADGINVEASSSPSICLIFLSLILPSWLEPLVDLARTLGIPDDSAENVQRFTNENIRAQVGAICRLDIVRNSWDTMDEPPGPVTVHGWLYELESGLLREVVTCRPSEEEGGGDS